MALTLSIPAEKVEPFCKLVAALLSRGKKTVRIELEIPEADARRILRSTDPEMGLEIHFNGMFNSPDFPPLSFSGTI